MFPTLDGLVHAPARLQLVALLEGAGVAKRMDDGFVELAKPDAAKDFIAACAKLRFWDREAVKKD